MAAPDPDTTPEGDSILDMYGESPILSTPPKPLDRNSVLPDRPVFDLSTEGESSFSAEGSKTRQLRDIQKRLSSLAALSADVSLASSRGSPNTSFRLPTTPSRSTSVSASVSTSLQTPSLTRQSAAESQLLDTISQAKCTLRHDLLVALLERVVADTVSLYTTLSEDDTNARAAVDRVSLSLADFITRYVALADNKPSSLKLKLADWTVYTV